MEPVQRVTGSDRVDAYPRIAGSRIGGIAETPAVIDDGMAGLIQAGIELIRPDDINRAYARVMNPPGRDRFVIGRASLQA